MALIQTNQAVPNGKCGDVVYYSGRWGNVARDNFTPYNPNSPRQAAIRMTYTDLTYIWNSLSKAERLTWSGAIKGGHVSNEYIEFLKHNINLAKIGKLPIRAYPQPGVTLITKKLDSRILKGTTNNFINWITGNNAIDLPADQYMVLSSTTNRAAHARQVDPPYRIQQVLPPLTVSPVDVYASYLTTWPIAPIIGMRIFTKAQIVNGITGDEGYASYTSTLVEP